MPAWIGITISHATTGELAFRNHVPDVYVELIARAGGAPVLIPVGYPLDKLKALRARLDGLLLTGGDDIDPALFGGQPHPKVSGIDAGRDSLEMALVRMAVETDWPFFAICRGVQVMNVALGGTLYTDIDDQLPGALKHGLWGVYARDYLAHEVRLQAGSRLETLMGERAGVNSFHHQGVQKIGAGLAATAWATDGLVEGLELAGHPFGLGVQWHPECIPQAEDHQALFRAFVAAAERE